MLLNVARKNQQTYMSISSLSSQLSCQAFLIQIRLDASFYYTDKDEETFLAQESNSDGQRFKVSSSFCKC